MNQIDYAIALDTKNIMLAGSGYLEWREIARNLRMSGGGGGDLEVRGGRKRRAIRPSHKNSIMERTDGHDVTLKVMASMDAESASARTG